MHKIGAENMTDPKNWRPQARASLECEAEDALSASDKIAAENPTCAPRP